MKTGQTLVVGIGSFHGDDQAGWKIAESVEARLSERSSVTVRLAGSPTELLHWLEGVDYLYVCDACSAFTEIGAVHWLTVKDGELVLTGKASPDSTAEIVIPFRNRSSHDLGLLQALRLAEITSHLPDSITVGVVEGQQFRPGDSISDRTRTGIQYLVEEICRRIEQTAQSPVSAAADDCLRSPSSIRSELQAGVGRRFIDSSGHSRTRFPAP